MHNNSLEAFKTVPLNKRESEVMAIFTECDHRALLTRQRLAELLGWQLCSLTGRVTALISKGVLMECGHSTVNGRRRALLCEKPS